MANWQRTVMTLMRIKNYPVTVKSIQKLTPDYCRITFHSPQAVQVLEGFPTEWVRLWVPGLGKEDQKIVQRGYTLTGLRPDLHEFDLEFVLHEVPGAAGDWAKSVKPGYQTEISLTPARPKIPEGVKHLILIGDLTALPAINSWIKQSGDVEAQKLTVLIEDGHGAEAGLPQEHADKLASWRWIQPHAVLGTALAQALQEEIDKDPEAYVWGAGEKELVKRVRTTLKAAGLPKERYFTQFYWILGKDFG